MYETVLVAVDGSETARTALERAVSIANATGATVHVLAVAEPDANPMAFGVDDVEAIDAAVADLVDAVAGAGVSPDRDPVIEVRRGRPAHEEIVEYAGEVDADVIFVGRQGTTSLSEAVLGSTADRLARTSPVPVVIVPGPDET
jgi:nucleotide-binding universal stress UspA family protein